MITTYYSVNLYTIVKHQKIRLNIHKQQLFVAQVDGPSSRFGYVKKHSLPGLHGFGKPLLKWRCRVFFLGGGLDIMDIISNMIVI